jgi:hypothetical protein
VLYFFLGTGRAAEREGPSAGPGGARTADDVRALRASRFQSTSPAAAAAAMLLTPKESVSAGAGASSSEPLQRNTDKDKDIAFTLVAPAVPAASAPAGAALSAGAMAPLTPASAGAGGRGSPPGEGEGEAADMAVEEAADMAAEEAATAPPASAPVPVPALAPASAPAPAPAEPPETEPKVLTEDERIEYVFGPAGVTATATATATGTGTGTGTGTATVTSKALASMLLREPSTSRALGTAACWWARAGEVSVSRLPQWRAALAGALELLLAERTPEEDLFTPDPTEELSACLLELLGYRVVARSGALRLMQTDGVKASLPVDFIRALFSINGPCSSGALSLLFSCFRALRLDTLPQDAFDVGVLAALRSDRSVAAALNTMLQREVALSLSASPSLSAGSAGGMERSGVMSALLSLSTIVPLSAVHSPADGDGGGDGGQFPSAAQAAACPQLSFFAGMPYAAAPAQLWCTNPSLLLRHTQMLAGNLSELLGVLHGLLERALRQGREAVLTWLARVIQLTHRYFAAGGRAALEADEGTDPDSCSSGFVLSLACLLLRLTDPLLGDPARFVPAVDWAYTKGDSRIEFSALPNMVDGSKPGAADTEEPLEVSPSSFSFSTEIFWLTARVMELVEKVANRRGEHMRAAWQRFEAARQLLEARPGAAAEAALARRRAALHALHYGWAASPLEDPLFLGLACRWAHFSAQWVLAQAAAADAPARFRHIPAGLVKAMCDVWILAARSSHPARALPGLAAADAALLCVQLMGRPLLAGSPVLQDRLLAVIDAFAFAGQGGEGPLAGVVMDNQVIRESLAPAVMALYSSCHAVAALDVNEDVAFDKNSIRSRANALLMRLYRHPLEEPRLSIRRYIAEGGGGGGGFEAFVVSAFDCIMYNFVEAVKTLAYSRRAEQRGRLADSRAPGNVRWMLGLSHSTFALLQLLCAGEGGARAALTGPALRCRVAGCLCACMQLVDSEARLGALRVSGPEQWGFEEEAVLGHPASLLAACLSSPDTEAQHAFLSAYAQHPDYEPGGLARAAELPGGAALRPYLALLTSNSGQGAGRAAQASPSPPPSRRGAGVDFDMFAGTEGDAEDIYTAFWLQEEQVRGVCVFFACDVH